MINSIAIYKGLLAAAAADNDDNDELIECTKEQSYHDQLIFTANEMNQHNKRRC